MNTSSKESVMLLAHMYLQHGKYDKARTLLEALQELFPEEPYLARSLAWLYQHEDRHMETLEQIELWRRLVKNPEPEHARMAFLIRAGALSGLGRNADSRAALKEFMTLSSSMRDTEKAAPGNERR